METLIQHLYHNHLLPKTELPLRNKIIQLPHTTHLSHKLNLNTTNLLHKNKTPKFAGFKQDIPVMEIEILYFCLHLVIGCHFLRGPINK